MIFWWCPGIHNLSINQLFVIISLDNGELVELSFWGETDSLGYVGIAEAPDDTEVTISMSRVSDDNQQQSRIMAIAERMSEEPDELALEATTWDIDWATLALKTSVEIAHFLMESTIKNQRFQGVVPTVGGDIKTVTITPDGVYKDISEPRGVT